MVIEKRGLQKNPIKINTTKVELKEDISDQEIENIIKPFSFDESQKIEHKKISKSLSIQIFDRERCKFNRD